VLEEVLLAHAKAPGWYAHSLRAMERALELRGAFLDSLFDEVPQRRVGPLLERIQAGAPLAPEQPEPRTIHLGDTSRGAPAVRSVHEERGIDFAVERVPFAGEVLEAHLLRVAPGHGSDARQHAHEAVLAVLAGTGRVRVNATEVEVRPGQLVFVPRWAWQQAHNMGEAELTLLVVTDQGLAARAHVGEYFKAARLARAEGGEG
jgi:mannose-6-phosphate isomerase-like protein (cupin superfamily)